MSDTVPAPMEIRLTSVTRSFPARRGGTPFVAVDDVSLRFATDSMIGIVGESGSGKSTLARMITGLDLPTSGTIELDGVSTRAALSSAGSREEFRRTVQFVAQDTTSSFDPRRKLRDAVRYPAMHLRGLSRKDADELVDHTFETLGLSPALADRYPRAVSGGQRQRISLARALVVAPRLLVCDEVVSALDVSAQGSVLNLLKRYCREHHAGLIFVSHGLPATAFVSTELVVMYHGRIVEQGPSHRVVEQPEHAYTKHLLAAHSRGRRAETAESSQMPEFAA